MQASTINNMLISRDVVQGLVKKKIQNTKMGLLEDVYHTRKLVLNLRVKPPTLILHGTEDYKQR